MIVNKQQQRVGILEPSTLPHMQDNVEHSPSGETTDTYKTNEKNTEQHSFLDLYALSSNCDAHIRSARVEEIKAQLARKQYHVDPRSLAQAIYNHSTKRHR